MMPQAHPRLCRRWRGARSGPMRYGQGAARLGPDHSDVEPRARRGPGLQYPCPPGPAYGPQGHAEDIIGTAACRPPWIPWRDARRGAKRLGQLARTFACRISKPPQRSAALFQRSEMRSGGPHHQWRPQSKGGLDPSRDNDLPLIRSCQSLHVRPSRSNFQENASPRRKAGVESGFPSRKMRQRQCYSVSVSGLFENPL